MALESSAEQVLSNPGVPTGWKKQEDHKNIHYGNPYSGSQRFFLLEQKGRVALSQ